MQSVLAAPRQGLAEADVLEALSLKRGASVRHGADVLTAAGVETGRLLRFEAAGSWVKWDYRAPDRVAGQTSDVAAVRRTASLVGPTGEDPLAVRLRLWTELRLREGAVSTSLVDAGPVPYSELVLSDSPVGYWRLGETAGTTAEDTSGGSRTATWTGTPSRVAGALVGSDNGAVGIATAAAAEGTVYARTAADFPAQVDTFTVEAWVWLDSAGYDANQAMLERSAGGTNTDWLLYYEGDKFSWRVINDGGTLVTITGALNPTRDAWHHVVGTCVGNTMRLYVDGVEVASTAVTRTAAKGAADVWLGRLATAGSYALNGRLDEAAVYNRALSAAEVTEHYRAGIDHADRPRKPPLVVTTPTKWARFYLGVFYVVNPGAVTYDGVRRQRTWTLADKSHLWASTLLPAPVTVPAGTVVTDYVKARLTSRFGEQSFSIPHSPFALAQPRTFEAGTSELEFLSRLLEAAAYDQLTSNEVGQPASQPLGDLAGKAPEVTYGAGLGKLVSAGQVEPLLPSLPNVVRFSARQGPSLGNVEGNGLRTVRNQSSGPASVDARGIEVVLTVDVDVDSQTELDAVAAADAQRYFAGGGRRWTGRVGLNPRHSDRDVIRLEHPGLDLTGGAWAVTSWTYPLGAMTDPGDAVMPITAERRVVTS